MTDALKTVNSTIRALSETVIREQIQAPLDFLDSIEVLSSIDSTSSYLLGQPIKLAKAKICLAEAQTSGRGRRGNHWLSAPNKNIMLSLSWGFSRWPETVTGLGLAMALVVAERLNHEHQLGVGIKWPNDLLIEDEKLAGILVDVTGEPDGACNVVLGLGLNVHQPDWSKEFASNNRELKNSKNLTDYAWTDLYSQGVMVDRNHLIAGIISDCLSMLDDFERYGFGHFISRWNNLSCHTGKQVALSKPNHDLVVCGRMMGVNDIGALLVRSDDGEQHIVSDSNLSLRLID